MAEAVSPLLSICVPTHHGRRSSLEQLLSGCLAQSAGTKDLVEVCIADNASRDGTEAMVQRISADAPLRVAYRRNPRDLGLAENLMTAVELARGEYCWLMGSDDLLAENALSRACELVRLNPGASGYSVGAISVDAVDPSLRSRALARGFHPPGETARIIEGLDPVLDECGNSWCALSWSIVDRARWLDAAAARRELALAHAVFPQVVIMATMAIAEPRWGWLAESLVLQRNATTFLFEDREAPVADRWSEIITAAASAWGAVLGSRWNARWRRRMRRLHSVWGGLADVRGTKLYGDAPLRSQARLAASCLGAFWPSRAYWRDVAAASLLPRRLTLLRYAPGSRSTLATRGPRAGSVSLSARLPGSLRPGAVATTVLALENTGRRTVREAGPGAVTVGQRWLTADGGCLSPSQLDLNEIASLPQSLPRRVRPRQTIRFELTLYAPVLPGAYRLELTAQSRSMERPDRRARVVGDVEVTPPPQTDASPVRARRPAELR